MSNQGCVRLSTFWHFQSDEKSEIGDPDEGQSGYMFQNNTDSPWVITPDLLDAAAMSGEGFSRFSESKTLPAGDESWIESAGGFNTYMYSLTEAEAPSKSLMERLDYDSAIEICDIKGFTKHTSKALLQYLKKEFKAEDRGVTRVRCSFGPVKYVPSKRKIVTPSTIEILQKIDSVDTQELFTKLTRFSYQREFRIAYYFMNPDTEKILSLNQYVPVYPVIVDNGSTPRISNTLRLIDPSEFVD